ncbi:MAG TPA: DinB family protein [Bryobacteraceae bacterium]|jgi:uncharacterized damage-inducible protein DinB
MNETIAQYSARIGGYIEGKDPLVVQRQTVETLTRLIEGVPEEALTRESAPGKWSVRDVLAHLAEAEMVSTWRYRQMIEQSSVTLTSFNQEEWARLGDYGATEPKESLEMLRILRKKNLQMFARLTPEEWECFGMHSERGKMTVEDLMRQIAGHDLNHIAQVREMVAKA